MLSLPQLILLFSKESVSEMVLGVTFANTKLVSTEVDKYSVKFCFVAGITEARFGMTFTKKR